MTTKRNIINEIKSIKERSEFDSRFDFTTRLQSIENAIGLFLVNHNEYNDELIKYIPIASVACIESFFRSIYKELIDYGKPFNENASDFNQSKNIKFDFSTILAIQSKTITIGEFISHILPCNSYEDINSNMSVLIKDNFTKKLKETPIPRLFEMENTNSEEYQNNDVLILNDIRRMFELRHIFCHEFATNLKIDQDEIINCFRSVNVFLNHVNDYTWELIYPNEPYTMADMVTKTKQEFEEQEMQLKHLLDKIKLAVTETSDFSHDKETYENLINSWKNYRQSRAEFHAKKMTGGSLYPLVYSASMKQVTNEFIESLSKEYETELRTFASR